MSELEIPSADELFTWPQSSRSQDSKFSIAAEIADREAARLLVAAMLDESPANGETRVPRRRSDAPSSSGDSEQSGAYACVRMSSVKAEKVNWLWKPYLPIGKITLLDGWPGIGKSWLTCKLAAIVTRGGGFPNGQAFEPGNVLMFSAEDGLDDTLRPRLDACGADVDKVIALNFLDKDGLAVFDQKGLIRFEATIIEYQPLLVIVDPLFAFTGSAVDIHRANECREVSRVLAAIAARQRCNMLCVRHLGKSGGNGSPMKAGLGSIDWLAAARVGLLAGCDPDDESKRALTSYKNNLAPLGASLGYRITFDPDTDVGSFEWIGISDLTAERILAPAHHEDQDEVLERVDAEDFLRSLLANGRQESAEVEKGRRAAGIPERAFKKAKAALRIKPYKEGGEFGGKGAKWYWELPPDWDLPQDGHQGGEPPPQDVQKTDGVHLVVNDSDKSSCDNSLPQDGRGDSFDHVVWDEEEF
jgi:hypothetical protein